MNQSEILAIVCNLLKARKKMSAQFAIGFGFASHWLKNWREIFKPVTKCSNRNRVIGFDRHLKTYLYKEIVIITKSKRFLGNTRTSYRWQNEKGVNYCNHHRTQEPISRSLISPLIPWASLSPTKVIFGTSFYCHSFAGQQIMWGFHCHSSSLVWL